MTTNDETTLDPVGELLVRMMDHAQRQSTHVLNQLYNAERRRRLALEVWVNDFQHALWDAHGGTHREMDTVVQRFAYMPMGYDEEEAYARRHADWRQDL